MARRTPLVYPHYDKTTNNFILRELFIEWKNNHIPRSIQLTFFRPNNAHSVCVYNVIHNKIIWRTTREINYKKSNQF